MITQGENFDRYLRSPILAPIAFSSVSSGLRAATPRRALEGLDYFFRRDVANQRVLRERASTQPAQGGVETTAARIVRGQNFCCSVLRTAVQVNPNLEVVVLRHHHADQFADLLWPAMPTVSAREIMRRFSTSISAIASITSSTFHKSP